MHLFSSCGTAVAFLIISRIMENALLSAEVKEGEILPPTIQKLMKGYNKYLRPFFDRGYNINDVMFYWTRGNDSVSGLDTLRLAQHTVGDYHTSMSEAIYETGHYPKLVFHFDLKRNILYFILETYVPSSLLVVLSWVSFWISQSSVPARICIGVTTVLTMTTLMMGARTSLPNANCFIKAIDVYLGICFSFIFGALIEYAVAHFCTLHHPDSSSLLMREENMNGVVTMIASNSRQAKKKEDASAVSNCSLSNSDIKTEAKEQQSKCAKTFYIVKRQQHVVIFIMNSSRMIR
ncbi:gamma-aminobutyric acid receptor subunit pi-like [Huso huso]|uniref:Gamma-aminobutyric acid receptor subunit pi-like n=1 Tax=Huso huso TaxID=61971 RepID=A0ABR0ZR90_HUSHU